MIIPQIFLNFYIRGLAAASSTLVTLAANRDVMNAILNVFMF